jgi:hypothetical protein
LFSGAEGIFSGETELELLILGDDERQLLHDFSGEWRHCPESLCNILCAMCVLEKDFGDDRHSERELY